MLTTTQPYLPGQMLVKVSGPDDKLWTDHGLEVVERFDFHSFPGFEGELVRVALPPGVAVEEALELATQDDRIDYAAPNHIYHLETEQRFPDDLHDRLYGLHNTGQRWGTEDADIDAPEAWAIQTGRADGPIIAVLDTGIDLDHPDLVANL